MLPNKPRDAIAIGLKHYFTGKPCPNGHVAIRTVVGRQCCECRSQVTEKHKAGVMAWQSKNKEKFKAYKEKWRSKNREKIAQKNAEWYESNKAKCFEKAAARRASKLMATPRWLTDEQKEEMRIEYQLAQWCSDVMGDEYHVDHIVPLKGKLVCGLHVPWNLRVIRGADNRSKGNRFKEQIA